MSRPKGESGREDATEGTPCGSEQESARPCSQREDGSKDPSVAQDAIAEVLQALEGKEFASEEEMLALAQDITARWGRRPLDDFHGLSPEQMHRLLHFPFDSPQFVLFPTQPGTPPAAPLLTLVELLIGAIGEQGLKATAKGNLPRKFVQKAALIYETVWRRQGYALGKVLKEKDFFELHVARLVAELDRLICKSRGTFLLRPGGRKAMTEAGAASLYSHLLLAYVRDFSWAYWDRYPALPFLQHSFLYTLYLLNRYGDQWRASSFYEDAFLRAFPQVLEEVAPLPYSTPEQQVRSCYSWRVLDRFAGFLGLVEIKREAKQLDRQFQVRSMPLLKAVAKFRTTSTSVAVSGDDDRGPAAIH
jgi:hypothetical protein